MNAGRVREIVALGDGEYELTVGGTLLKSSRRYRRALSGLMKKGRLGLGT